MTPDEKIAYLLFRYVHGGGDAGSEKEFHYQNQAMQEGWVRLAKIMRPLLREDNCCECSECARARAVIKQLEKGK